MPLARLDGNLSGGSSSSDSSSTDTESSSTSDDSGGTGFSRNQLRQLRDQIASRRNLPAGRTDADNGGESPTTRDRIEDRTNTPAGSGKSGSSTGGGTGDNGGASSGFTGSQVDQLRSQISSRTNLPAGRTDTTTGGFGGGSGGDSGESSSGFSQSQVDQIRGQLESRTNLPAGRSNQSSDSAPQRSEFDNVSDYVEASAEHQFGEWGVSEGEVFTVRESNTVRPVLTARGAEQAFADMLGGTADRGDVSFDEEAKSGFGVSMQEFRNEISALQADMNERRGFRKSMLRDAQAAARSEAGQDARRRQQQMRSDFLQGNLGDTREIIAEDAAKNAGDDVTENDIIVRRTSGGLTTAQSGSEGSGGGGSLLSADLQELVGGAFAVGIDSNAEQKIVSKLEKQTGVDLDTSDVTLEKTTKDGNPAFTGTLTEAAEKQVAKEQAPGQGTPAEGVFEFGAGLHHEYEEFAEENRAAVQNAVPDVDTGLNIGETFNDITPDSTAFYGAAAAAAPAAAVEPTPFGEIGTAGIAALGTAAAVGATWSVGAAEQDAPTASAAAGAAAPVADSGEVSVPTNGVFQNELAITGAETVFTPEHELPDKQAIEDFGAPEQGLVIDPTEFGVGNDVTEVAVPDNQGAGGELEVPTGGGLGGVAQTGTAVGTGGGAGTGVGEPTGPSIGESGGPSIGETGGDVSDLPVGGIGGSVVIRDTGIEGDRTLTDATQKFFGVDLVDPFANPGVHEAAQQQLVGSGGLGGTGLGAGAGTPAGTQPGPESAPNYGPGVFPGVAADTGVDADTASGVESFPTAGSQAFGLEAAEPQQFAENPAFGPATPTAVAQGTSTSPRKRRRFGFEPKDDKKKRKSPAFGLETTTFQFDLPDVFGGGF